MTPAGNLIRFVSHYPTHSETTDVLYGNGLDATNADYLTRDGEPLFVWRWLHQTRERAIEALSDEFDKYYEAVANVDLSGTIVTDTRTIRALNDFADCVIIMPDGSWSLPWAGGTTMLSGKGGYRVTLLPGTYTRSPRGTWSHRSALAG